MGWVKNKATGREIRPAVLQDATTFGRSITTVSMSRIFCLTESNRLGNHPSDSRKGGLSVSGVSPSKSLDIQVTAERFCRCIPQMC